MSKYEVMTDEELQFHIIADGFHRAATWDWEYCYNVMDALLEITTGVNLKSDGTATTEISGKQQSAGGGHCRAVCELYLMAKDAEVKHDRQA